MLLDGCRRDQQEQNPGCIADPGPANWYVSMLTPAFDKLFAIVNLYSTADGLIVGRKRDPCTCSACPRYVCAKVAAATTAANQAFRAA